MIAPVTERLPLHENALASAMLLKIGNATVQFAQEDDGTRHHTIPRLSEDDFNQLSIEFGREPKDCLGWARESLLAINTDERLNGAEKDHKLDRYMDAYFNLTLKLDHAAFPPTKPGEVKKGVPDYIPDGFVDMGGESSLSAASRNREQIQVDKAEVFKRYRPLLKEIFSHDFGNMDVQQRKKMMAVWLAKGVYSQMSYDYALAGNGDKDLGGGKVKLSSLPEGVCRHQALTFQVLAQAVGLKTQVLKAHMDGVRHATNMLRIDHEWYLFDVTNPDYVLKPNGEREWKPGAHKIDGPPRRGGSKRYDVTAKYSGKRHIYDAHDDMYWHIETPPTVKK